jgi:hypothetical protein
VQADAASRCVRIVLVAFARSPEPASGSDAAG